jgi:hypothetical protein
MAGFRHDPQPQYAHGYGRCGAHARDSHPIPSSPRRRLRRGPQGHNRNCAKRNPICVRPAIAAPMVSRPAPVVNKDFPRINSFAAIFALSSFSPTAKRIFAQECAPCDGAKIIIFRSFRGFIPRKLLFASVATRELSLRISFVTAQS